MISIVLGTRPEIIKMSPVIRECEDRGVEYSILHTGQHYSYEMDRKFFEQLDLPRADNNLDVGSGTHAQQTGRIMKGIEKVLMRDPVDAVLVQGDTNTVLAGALVSAKLQIPVGHVEAGLRSFDRRMPEEINRIVADHVGEYLFAPTEISRGYLLDEGLPEAKIHVVGNTIVDSLRQNLAISESKVDPLKDLGLSEKGYFLVTSHRAENVDVRQRFEGILEGLRSIHEEFDLPVIYPIHPRARKFLKRYKLETGGIELIDPVGFLEFLRLESGARLVLTDSGGVQEETCILGVPCVTLRDNTERPETIEVGSNVLAGAEPFRILERTREMLISRGNWSNPFGDGESSRRIVNITTEDIRQS
ncbi:MAG: non-hydrolyzing UDP-N-acetylglucosamine 2-epimerase [Thermoplasmatota archaeon]